MDSWLLKTSVFKNEAHSNSAATATPAAAAIPPAQAFDRPPPHGAFGVTRSSSPNQRLPKDFSIEPITATTVPSFRRIISLLLPIRYPDKFFAESVADVTPSSLARVALWHDRPRPAKRKREEDVKDIGSPSTDPNGADSTLSGAAPGTVVGGIQCRHEQLPSHPSLLVSSQQPEQPAKETKGYCYIQTLAVLSPYRSKGIATALLDVIITALCVEKVYNGVVSVYAHVWEANEEALEWYVKRGFQVGEVVQGYYRRLKPAGARIVWRDLKVEDYLRAQAGDGSLAMDGEL
ncbi:MAG: hypothetical protein LQ346_004198 [Caloplaca aetnensis]|nr:MAG: hypothetical protein LQ346_004198 [Caloplaca aetnensis]